MLGVALKNRFTACLAGLGITALLQNRTATALMTATFVTDGLVGLMPALAIMLGANIGTTLIVQFIGPLPAFARLREWLLPKPAASPDPSAPIYLDAIASARRRWRLPPRHARRCTWATWSRPCCGRA